MAFARDPFCGFWHQGNVSKLTATRIKTALTKLPEWKHSKARLTRAFVCQDFVAAIKLVNAVAQLAEQAGHHPDIDIRWNQVTLTLTTHSAGGLTQKDFSLAKAINQLELN